MRLVLPMLAVSMKKMGRLTAGVYRMKLFEEATRVSP